MLSKKIDQKGLTAPFLLFIAAAGLIFFFVIGSVSSFKDSMFKGLFPKPVSRASQCIPVDSLPISVSVLVLEYYPRDSGNSNLLDGLETGWKQDASISGRTIQFWEEKTQEMISRGIPLINEATKYHGYKNATAPQFLNYQVLEKKKFYEPMPKGHLLENKPAGNAYRPDYGKILKNLNICDYVDNKGVKEVWIYGYHNDNGIVPDESRMSSRHGDISNSQPKEEGVAEQYRMPVCQNSYVLYNFTYQPNGDPGNNLHNRGHQIENIIPFAEGEGKWPPTVANTQGSIFWGDFSEYVQDNSPFVTQGGGRVSSYKSSCGNIHITPNWSNTKTQGYLYDLTETGSFNCETWHPDESKTIYSSANCDRWSCNDTGFYKWWMQNMPGFNNGIEYQGKKMRNWWEAMYDFNAFVDKGRSLFGESIFCDISVQTAIPTATPASTPTTTPIPTATSTPAAAATPVVAARPIPSNLLSNEEDDASLSDFNTQSNTEIPYVDTNPVLEVSEKPQSALELIRNRQESPRATPKLSGLPEGEQELSKDEIEKKDGEAGGFLGFISKINEKIADGVAFLLEKAGLLKKRE